MAYPLQSLRYKRILNPFLEPFGMYEISAQVFKLVKYLQFMVGKLTPSFHFWFQMLARRTETFVDHCNIACEAIDTGFTGLNTSQQET